MNRLAIAYVMDHLPSWVMQDPTWMRATHDHLAAEAAWWPWYVLRRWAPPVGFMTVEEAHATCTGDDTLLPIDVLMNEAADEARLPVGQPWTVHGCPVVRLGNQLSRCEERAIARAKART